MTHQEDLHPEVPFGGMEEILEEVVEEDSLMEEEDHPMEEEDPQEEATIMEIEDQTSWWETLRKYSKEYERKLSRSLPFGGSTQALTAKTPPLPMRTKEVSYSSHIFKETTWQNGSSR